MNFNTHRAPTFILLHVFVIYNCYVLRLARGTKANISQLGIPSDGLYGFMQKCNEWVNQIETFIVSTLFIDFDLDQIILIEDKWYKIEKSISLELH